MNDKRVRTKRQDVIIAALSQKNLALPPHATFKKAVQKRINLIDRSSIIPGIDINELKRSLDLLKYALDYSEAIVDTVREPLIVLDKYFRVLTANKSFYSVFHLDPSNTENKLIYEIGKGQWNVPRLKVLLEKILPKNTHFENFEVEYYVPNLGPRTFLLSARRTYRQVNETEAILLAFEDATERINVERQKDDFIGTVSHELKNPLTSIQIFSELLKNHLNRANDKKGTIFLEKLEQQVKKLNELMASFTNVYKIQTGQLKLKKDLFNVSDLVGEVVSDFQYSGAAYEIVNKVDSKGEVFADKKRIRQVLVNLISNAIKYSPDVKKVVLISEDEKERVVICIRDFGRGVPEREQQMIFSRFYRSKSDEKDRVSGLGLGLYISAQIVKQHKGGIWVKSVPGKGSSFYFSLPANQ